jgi:DNA-binding NarL/FixJ family response regulator
LIVQQIRVLIADEHKMICEAIGQLLKNEVDIKLVAEAYNCDEMLAIFKEFQPDVSVIALQMLTSNNLKVSTLLLKEAPGCKLIALAENSERRDLIDAFKSGVMGYVLKESTSSELVRAIRSVACNYRYLDQSLMDVVIFEERPHPLINHPFNRQQILTPREREVLRKMAEGKTNNDITSELDISAKTIEAHRRHILKKLNLRNIADLTRYAIKEGISPL